MGDGGGDVPGGPFWRPTNLNKATQILTAALSSHRTYTENTRLSKVVPKVTTLLLKGCQRISKVVKRLSY